MNPRLCADADAGSRRDVPPPSPLRLLTAGSAGRATESERVRERVGERERARERERERARHRETERQGDREKQGRQGCEIRQVAAHLRSFRFFELPT